MRINAASGYFPEIGYLPATAYFLKIGYTPAAAYQLKLVSLLLYPTYIRLWYDPQHRTDVPIVFTSVSVDQYTGFHLPCQPEFCEGSIAVWGRVLATTIP
jgi:hypothetical protein